MCKQKCNVEVSVLESLAYEWLLLNTDHAYEQLRSCRHVRDGKYVLEPKQKLALYIYTNLKCNSLSVKKVGRCVM